VTNRQTWIEQPISRSHDRDRFECGVPPLDLYLRRYARQNHASGSAKTFVAVDPAEAATILGYYTITIGSIEFERVPADLFKGQGRYEVPVFRIARLAVSRRFQGLGVGTELFASAGLRALAASAEVGGVALAIDAKDAGAANWYARFGASPLLDDPLKLVLPLDVFVHSVGIVRDS